LTGHSGGRDANQAGQKPALLRACGRIHHLCGLRVLGV